MGLRVLGLALTPLRLLLVGLLALGLPLFLYLTCADEPVFEPEQDVALGQRTVAAIAGDPEQYPLLPPGDHPDAYAHLQGMVDRLLRSPQIGYREIFAYDQIVIIDDDATLNAFCTPGGFIYVYSGLIRYLDAEDHLAGVLGHEIAHAELRHSSKRLQKEFGVQRLLEFALLSLPVSAGDVVNAAILKQLTTLRYSRKQEAQADAYSVDYLASSGYACDGTAGFFEKLVAEGDDVGIPAFLSDHPDSAARVRDIQARARELGCNTALEDPSDWRQLQASLPPPEASRQNRP